MAFGSRFKRQRGSHEGGDVHGELTITPLLDLFVALIPFLIMSVVLSKVNVLDVGIAAPGATASAPEASREREIEVKVFPNRAEIMVDNKAVAQLRKAQDDRAWAQELHVKLVEIKKQKLDDLKIYFEPVGNVSLDTMMAFMDSARELRAEDGELFRKEADGREVKLRYLFPKIVLRGVYN